MVSTLREETEVRSPVARKINREVVVLLGWGPAILMQVAHPLVLAGVLDHSIAVADPRRRLERLRSTIEAMLFLTFGTPEQAQSAADGINKIHDYVQGQLAGETAAYPKDTRYTAHDPELLRWVHATLVETLPRAYELYVGPLTAAEKDAYAAEAATIGPLLGVADGLLPATTDQLRGYMQGVYRSGSIEVTPEARRLATELELSAPLLPPIVRPLAARLQPAIGQPARLAIAGLLPPHLRRAYGYIWTPVRAATLQLFGAISRQALRATPAGLRYWPAAR